MDRPRVEIVGTQKNRVIRGTSLPFAAIEAVNMSTLPRERVLPMEPVVIARADERGRFAGAFPMRCDDVVRVRARNARGAVGPWTTFRARGLDGRPRSPQVALFRIGLCDLEDGTIKLFSIVRRRPIAEPHARLSFANTRTDDRIDAVVDESGMLPGRLRIPGRAGDVLSVECRGRRVGALLTPSPRPPRGLLRPSGFHQKLGFVPTVRRFSAPLFARRPAPFEVFQSELSNCYLASAAAAIAHVDPGFFERAIARDGDDAFRVRFRIGRTRRGHDVSVTSELYVRPSGELLYGSSADRGEPPSLWWPVLEKAYAKLRGSYRRVGRGGTSHRVLELLLGRPPRHFYIVPWDPEPVWRELIRAERARLPVVAGTSPPWTAKKFFGTGLVPDHAYAVLGCRVVRGERRVVVRNPWGEDVRPPRRARKNGTLEVGLEEFVRLFQVVSTVR